MRTTLTLLAGLFAGAHLCAQSTCLTPIAVTSGTYTVAAVNGLEIPQPLCAPNGSTNVTAGMWYSYTSEETLQVTLTTDLPQNGGTDTRVHIYSGSCGELECVAGDDDSGLNFTSVVTWTAEAGVDYRIAFDNRWSSSGFDFRITTSNDPPPPTPPVTFTNMSVSTSGSALAVVDMNNDFLDDVVSVSSTNVRIARQQPGGSFDVVNLPTPQATHSPSWSLVAGDIDANGHMDLLYGGGQGVTFMFANEDGTAYTEVTGPEYVFSQRSNLVDLNNDGHLDAFVCHDVQPNVYYMNDGQGNLTFFQGGLGDVSSGGNYGSIWIDYDNDGDVDLFIAKCRGGTTPANINEMHRNNGDGTFTNVAAQIGLEDNIQTWSAAWGDFDNDGFQDVFVGASSFANGGHKLMRNLGGVFENVTEGSGLDEFPGTSIEHVAHDFNNDGYIDILAGGNGHLMVNNGDFTFTPYQVGVSAGGVGDLNNDGFLDVLNGSTIRMNVPNNNNWIKINTIGVESNRHGVGARVTVTSALGTQMRDIKIGDGFRHMSSITAHFGLGQDTEVEEVAVHWPSGLVSVIPNPGINTTLNVTESISTGVAEEAAEKELQLFPNPASDILWVKGSEALDQRRIMIIDGSGRLVQDGFLRNGTVNVSRLAPGSYVLQLEAEGRLISQRFTKG